MTNPLRLKTHRLPRNARAGEQRASTPLLGVALSPAGCAALEQWLDAVGTMHADDWIVAGRASLAASGREARARAHEHVRQVIDAERLDLVVWEVVDRVDTLAHLACPHHVRRGRADGRAIDAARKAAAWMGLASALGSRVSVADRAALATPFSDRAPSELSRA